VIVNLSSFEQYLMIPAKPGELKKKKKTVSNVFRMWKEDTKEDIDTTIHNDVNGDFDASLFMKDPEDVENGYVIIKNNFKMI